MKPNFRLIFTFILAIKFSCFFGQNFKTLNNLPPTIEVRAPEFNTSKTFYFKVDSIHNNVIIQDLRSSKNGKVHFYQWLYEIPIEELDKTSFEVSKSFENELQLVINTKSNSILKYMFQNGKVVSISTDNKLILGDWNSSPDFLNLLKSNVESVLGNLPLAKSSLEKSKNTDVKFKYVGNKVRAINAEMDEDLSIGNDYYFGQIDDINFNMRKFKRALKDQNIDYKDPLPIIIYADKEGGIESVFIGSKNDKKHPLIDLSSIKPIKPLSFENKNVPAKYVFLITNN
ncbi:hypothetical protein ACFQ0R_05755 [Psychroflexus salinarum]|uniref:Uncharacterized protein n=1 Tax=Psychroflexus salinarum TaxID=546024 RepID=A0ABW3GPD1_9FLAO